ncbi:hypothetical protein D9O40_00770 [Clostridium autoethanogenum]|uniref:Uncharacterized protein n=1 Tax=Clostridium autoethanogenum TaxID=84023 RepID=A0A3M0T3U5_9CLOT|nr:hypothetical protein [Clostridium autoethanogenum]RMD04915.1 hypothetical protein D9O40_00770 [Clostridium autoethanogenum]
MKSYSKGQIRIHERLSNGQYLNVYFMRHKAVHQDKIIYIWAVGVAISKTIKQANFWFNGKKNKIDNKQTGKCGLEGLKKALYHILEFVNKMSIKEELQVCWTDEKRKKAYNYLIKYGFIADKDCYSIRNPKYWECKE